MEVRHRRGAGAGRRPHLTVEQRAARHGPLRRGSAMIGDYRRGYLCGIIRGDGHIGSYSYTRDGGARDEHTGSGSRCATRGARRARSATSSSAGRRHASSSRSTGRPAPRGACRRSGRSARDGRAHHASSSAWPLSPSDDWRKGFLAGIFDAEGSCGGRRLRISNTDRRSWTGSLRVSRHFGFDHVEEPRQPNGLSCVRVRGGPPRAAALLPPRRSGDHAQADGRRAWR